jgi:hypothetical protein
MTPPESSADDIAGLRRKNSEYEQRYKEAVKDAERSSDLLLAQVFFFSSICNNLHLFSSNFILFFLLNLHQRRLNEQQQKQIHKLQDELQLARGEVALLKKSAQPPSSQVFYDDFIHIFSKRLFQYFNFCPQTLQKNPTQLLIEADQQLKAQVYITSFTLFSQTNF